MTLRVVDLVSTSFRAMGTDVHVLVLDGADDDLAWARAEIERDEARWSRFRSTSDVSRLSAAAGEWVSVDAETIELLREVVRAQASTGGAFDPLLGGPLAALGYDRSFEHVDGGPAGAADLPPVVPSAGAIDLHPADLLARIPAGTVLDLGGIAKGWTADQLVAGLLARGARGACANVGGDLAVAGAAPDPAGWVIEVERNDPGGPPALLGLHAGGLATSTTQRRTWLGPAGDRRHHLLDPRTGRPVVGSAVEVTVVASSAAAAEVLTKVAFVAPDRLDDRLRAAGAVALLTDQDGTVTASGDRTKLLGLLIGRADVR
jgi:FAD:protein FMN transferase